MDLASATDVGALAEELRSRAARTGIRQIVGIVGAPGTGKSTLAQRLAEDLGHDVCSVVPMDGFHLANAIIDGTPLRDRKGAIDTFDAGGYLSLLGRLRTRNEPMVYAPAYRRGLEEPIAASIAIPRELMIILTEGNYLLADADPWRHIPELVDEIWFVDTPPDVRINRLIDRHVQFGMERSAAEKWANGPDEINAQFVESTRYRANRVILWS